MGIKIIWIRILQKIYISKKNADISSKNFTENYFYTFFV